MKALKVYHGLLAMAALLLLSLSAASCSDDDDDEVAEAEADVADAVVGTHEGYASVGFTYISYLYTYTGETLTITKASASTVDVAYSNETWGDYSVEGAEVESNSDGTYSLSGTGSAAIASAYHGTSSTYECTLAATVASDGTITELTFTMSFMGTTTVTFVEGDAPGTFEVASDYEGSMAMTVSSVDCGSVDMTVAIAAESEESVLVTLDAFDISVSDMHMDMSIGEIAISGVSVADNGDGTYTLSCEDFTVEDVDYDESTITVTGSLEGTIDADGNASITMPLTFGSMPMPVNCVFTGSVAE